MGVGIWGASILERVVHGGLTEKLACDLTAAWGSRPGEEGCQEGEQPGTGMPGKQERLRGGGTPGHGKPGGAGSAWAQVGPVSESLPPSYLFSSLAWHPWRTRQARAPRTTRFSLTVVSLLGGGGQGAGRHSGHMNLRKGGGPEWEGWMKGSKDPLTLASSALGRSLSVKHCGRQERLC